MGVNIVVVKHSHREDNDVCSNPAAPKKQTLGDPRTEGSSMVQTGSEWKTSDIKLN